ncbi:MAG: MoaD/ThiS family protein [Gemmatimonadaceae bacterium]
MMVSVRLFASFAEILGFSELEMELPDGARVNDVMTRLSALPGGHRLPPSPLLAVNLSYATPETPLDGGDEVAIIPPVAGG